MDNLDYIESYFSNEPDSERAREFEKRIETDPGFAEDVAFYLSVLNVSREKSQEERKQHFKAIYQQNQDSGTQAGKTGSDTVPFNKTYGRRPVRKLIYYIATAAIVTGIIFGTNIFMNAASPKQLADQYIKENLQTLSVTMGSKSDSLQTGLQLYNDGKFNEALVQFESMVRSDSSFFTAKEYAGLSALQLKEYNRALVWFEALETHTLQVNPALLYQAITLMERNQTGDVAKANVLLKKIVAQDLEGKEKAQEWLGKW
jgi:tetratricopeptide (TPR) repeat protein